ncbi:MAG: purine-nucleoside phosphorylase [Chitinophagaceae bacterium]|nr:purine-nucleoside phosphorylase [Chitinophagaceae bacterium]
MDLLNKIEEAAAYVQSRSSHRPVIGVILGSGLGGFTEQMEVDQEIEYATIPHFPVSTVEGHSGKMLIGSIGGKSIITLSGRFHYYEGYSTQEVVFPIRVLQKMGVKNLLITNAAGGTNTDFKVGNLMVIKDHISFAIVNPLIGKNFDELGTRFPDMSEPYSKKLISKAHEIAEQLGFDLKEGVYFGVTGPSFETRAEYKLIHHLGADAVGVSTVQEVIGAVHAGMQIFAISVITDIGI